MMMMMEVSREWMRKLTDLLLSSSSPLNKVLGETVNGPVRQTTVCRYNVTCALALDMIHT